MIRHNVKRVADAVLSPFGLELSKQGTVSFWRSAAEQVDQELAHYREYKLSRNLWLRDLAPSTVIDVGANTGWFSKQIRTQLPEAMIYAFEPLPECYAELVLAFADDHRFRAYNLGLGDISGRVTFDRNEFSPSSSFLKVNQTHKDAFPYTSNTWQVEVGIERLDSIAKDIEIDMPLLLKIDVQGFEDRVLFGGEATARKAGIVLIETSFVELYEAQVLFDDIYQILTSWNFRYQGSFDQLRDPHTGVVLQEDSVFVKNFAPRHASDRMDDGLAN